MSTTGSRHLANNCKWLISFTISNAVRIKKLILAIRLSTHFNVDKLLIDLVVPVNRRKIVFCWSSLTSDKYTLLINSKYTCNSRLCAFPHRDRTFSTCRPDFFPVNRLFAPSPNLPQTTRHCNCQFRNHGVSFVVAKLLILRANSIA